MTSLLSHTPRFDPFLAVHKAVRHVMFEVMTQVGALDTADFLAVDRCVRQVARLVAMLPNATESLLPLLESLQQRDPAERRAAAAQLYQEVTMLVAEQLRQQQHLAAVQAPRLQMRHDDAELRALRRGQLAAMDEADLAEALRAMAVALSPQELASMLDDVQASVDPQTFSCLADTVRRQLGAERWARVVRECGLAEMPVAAAGRHRPRAGRPGAPAVPQQRRAHRAERHRLLAQ